jgi:glycosyltransferase involved in cell wall biosynthesis
MHILLISGEFPPMQGGVGDYTREMARAFSDQGHQVSVAVSNALADDYEHADTPGWQVYPVIQDWKWGCWSQLRSLIGQIKPDILDLQYQAAVYDMRVPAVNAWPLIWSRRGGRPPIAVTFHDLKPPYLFPKAGLLRNGVVRLLARSSDAIIVTNAEDLAIARQWSFAVRRSRPDSPQMLHQIPIGSNIAVSPPAGYRRDEWRARRGYLPQDTVWAYFGFLNESKGGETLVRALALSEPPAHLLMIGGRTGSSDPTNRAYAERVESLIAELGVAERVRWTGYVPTEKVSAALLSVDIVVLPYRDGISFRRGSLHAALAHGCAIISTKPHVMLPELQERKNIALVPPEEPKAIAQAAQLLHRDTELRRRIGQGAALLAEQFTWEQIARRTVDQVFAPLLADR